MGKHGEAHTMRRRTDELQCNASNAMPCHALEKEDAWTRTGATAKRRRSPPKKKKGYASILLAAYAAKKEFRLAVLNDSDADPCQFL